MNCRTQLQTRTARLLLFTALATGCGRESAAREPSARTAAARGRLAVAKYGCDACHSIGTLKSPRVNAAGPLDGIAQRSLIAGVLPNTLDNLARWISDPRQVKPRTAMPSLDVSAEEARDIAVYLTSLK